MKRPRYYKVSPGEVFSIPIEHPGRLALWATKCCGCGLEHVVVLSPAKKVIQAATWRREDLIGVRLPPLEQRRKREIHPRRKTRAHD